MTVRLQLQVLCHILKIHHFKPLISKSIPVSQFTVPPNTKPTVSAHTVLHCNALTDYQIKGRDLVQQGGLPKPFSPSFGSEIEGASCQAWYH